MLSMRDQIDSDITFYLYATIDFIENAIKESEGKAKILVHCFKVKNKQLKNFRGTPDLQLLWQLIICGRKA